MKLTTAQAETLREIIYAGFADGAQFSVLDIYPDRDNQGNADRQTIRRLSSKGLLEHVSLGGRDYYRLKVEGIKAYGDWQAAQDLRCYPAPVKEQSR